MDNPKLYHAVNPTQHKSIQDIFEEYKQHIKWNQDDNEEILDIGCATGDVTHDILLPFLPSSIKRLLGVDINEKMIETAKEKYSSNPKIEFDVLDIGKKIPDKFKNKFDHIFSFFCFHWIQNQKFLMENIFGLLKPGGQTFFMFILDCHQVHGNYLIMSKDPKWKSYLSTYNEIAPPYRNEKNPAGVLRKNIESSGLVVNICEINSKALHFPNEKIFKDFLESINPFVKNMPDDVKEEYMTEYFKLVQEGDPTKTNNGPLIMHFDFLLASASKIAS